MVAWLIIDKRKAEISYHAFYFWVLLLNQSSVCSNGLNMKSKKENWKFNMKYLGAEGGPAMKNTDVRVLWTWV